MELSDKQLEFLRALEYLSSSEIKDLILGFTSIDVLLDVNDLEQFFTIA